MGAALPSVSVVIPTFRRRELLASVLEPVLRQPACEVVVVVDGCADGSLELLQQLQRTHSRIRPLWRDNGGEGAARQSGLAAATGEVVLFLDDDVHAGEGLVEGHARRQAEAPRRVVLGYMPTALPQPRRPGQFATVLYSLEYEAACRRYEDGSADVLSTLWAGNMSMRRDDALRVGMTGGDFGGLYHADQDLGLRCAAAGLTGIFDRGLVASHDHERRLQAFVRDAQAQGAGRVKLSVEHPDRLAPPSDEDFLSGLPATARRLAGNEGMLASACAVLSASITLSGRARLYGAETRSAQLLRRFEQLRGARQQRQELFALGDAA